MTVPPPGAGTFLTANTAVDVAATAHAEGWAPARQNTNRAGTKGKRTRPQAVGTMTTATARSGWGPYRDEDVLLSLQLFA